MEDETFFNEKQSIIRDSARSLKKYGSISNNHIKRTINEILIKHEIQQNDTLQGIALKYSCSMEQIRRANRLLLSDSIFLRQYLLIPIVEKDSPFYPKDRENGLPPPQRPHSLPPQRAASIAGCSSSGASTSSDINKMDFMSPEEESRKSMEDFLGKIDSSIANSRKYIAESQKNSEFMSSMSDDNIFSSGGTSVSSGYYSKARAHSTASSNSSLGSYQQYYQYPLSYQQNNNHHKRQSSSGSNNGQTGNDTVQLIAMSQGSKRVISSLQKLEKRQDEMFEL